MGVTIMFCSKCGTENPDTNKFCNNCGKAFIRPQPSIASAPEVTSPPAPQDYYVPLQPAQLTAGIQPKAAHPPEKTMLVLGIGSTLLGAVAWFRYPYICGILAIVLGGIVLYKSENKKSKAAILGIIGIIIGLASIVVDLFFFSFFPPGNGITV
jgi:hypothetical protein